MTGRARKGNSVKRMIWAAGVTLWDYRPENTERGGVKMRRKAYFIGVSMGVIALLVSLIPPDAEAQKKGPPAFWKLPGR
jgi:hypothetical protein